MNIQNIEVHRVWRYIDSRFEIRSNSDILYAFYNDVVIQVYCNSITARGYSNWQLN